MYEIYMTIDGIKIPVTIEESIASTDFLSLLPLSLTLDDYNEIEKVVDLPKRLSIEGLPGGYAPSAGDIAYYAPWGNLAVFYRDFAYAQGLVRLGRIDSGVEILERQGSLRVRIERAE